MLQFRVFDITASTENVLLLLWKVFAASQDYRSIKIMEDMLPVIKQFFLADSWNLILAKYFCEPNLDRIHVADP